MIIQPVVVLLGPCGQVSDGVIYFLDRQSVQLCTVDAVAHAHSYSLHGLTEVLLVFLQVRRLCI